MASSNGDEESPDVSQRNVRHASKILGVGSMHKVKHLVHKVHQEQAAHAEHSLHINLILNVQCREKAC